MAITPGTLLGVYEIIAAIGEGGMGQVFRARDTKLDRDVAVKVLPEAFAHDADRLARFTREAKTLATLNHSHIAGIYGLEESGGVTALVMELVEGEDLSQRVARGAIPTAEALPLAKQIAEALEAAHEQGIVHRDLKPANIKVRPDGTVKLLDFGLAKAMEIGSGSSPNVTQSPTLTSPAMTQAGMILGTAAYMSPEQARGKAVDRRADIWAFGVVLYEMLTGTRAFAGDEVQDTFAAIMRDEPDWTRLPATLSPTLAVFLKRCLHKDTNERIQAIADVRLALGGAFDTMTTAVIAPSRAGAPRRAFIAWAMGAALLALGGASGLLWARHSQAAPAEQEVRFDLPVTLAQAFTDDPGMAVSPDGRHIVFVALVGGQPQLLLRALDDTASVPLRGTTGGMFPFWSPDSRFIAFFTSQQLLRTDVAGGLPRPISPAANAKGGAWGTDDVIVFGLGSGGLFRVPAGGGDPKPVTRLDASQSSHRHPSILPDVRHVLFTMQGQPEVAGIYLAAIEGSGLTKLIAGATNPVFAQPNMLLFIRAGTLFGQHFDPVGLTLSGEPIRIADGVGGFSASRESLLAYRTGAGVGGSQLSWFDRTGRSLGTVGPADFNAQSVELSPDGRYALVHRTVGGSPSLWVLDLERGTPSRLTDEPAPDMWPIWSADGSRVIFTRVRNGKTALLERASTGIGPDKVLTEAEFEGIFAVSDASKDGRFVLFRAFSQPSGPPDLWGLPLDRDVKPFVWLKTAADEFNGQFSPDGKWVAYGSDETGRFEVSIQGFPVPRGSWRVSTDGGVEPRWRPDGKELFYIAADGSLMAVAVEKSLEGTVVHTGKASPLFRPAIFGGFNKNARIQYAASPDGQRFLVNAVTRAADSAPAATVVLNWRARFGR